MKIFSISVLIIFIAAVIISAVLFYSGFFDEEIPPINVNESEEESNLSGEWQNYSNSR